MGEATHMPKTIPLTAPLKKTLSETLHSWDQPRLAEPCARSYPLGLAVVRPTVAQHLPPHLYFRPVCMLAPWAPPLAVRRVRGCSRSSCGRVRLSAHTAQSAAPSVAAEEFTEARASQHPVHPSLR